jgi:hypothetical protein
MGKFVRKHANSSGITSVAYDEMDCVLEVVFCKGGIYEYNQVSQKEFNNLRNSDSVGEFFNKHIRKTHKHRKVRD